MPTHSMLQNHEWLTQARVTPGSRGFVSTWRIRFQMRFRIRFSGCKRSGVQVAEVPKADAFEFLWPFILAASAALAQEKDLREHIKEKLRAKFSGSYRVLAIEVVEETFDVTGKRRRLRKH